MVLAGEPLALAQQVVAQHHRYFEVYTGIFYERTDGIGAGLGIDTAGVGEDFYALSGDVLDVGLECTSNKVGGVARLGVLGVCSG